MNVNNDISNLPIYIIHYKKLIDRKKYLDAMFNMYDFTNINWVSHIDRNTMTSEDLAQYKFSTDRWHELCSIWGEYDSVPRKLSGPEIACCLSHLWIYNDILKHGHKVALIFEDDAILLDGFRNKLNVVLNELPEDFHTCHLTDSFGWSVATYKQGYFGAMNNNVVTESQHVYKMGSSRCADAYLISLDAAQKLRDNITPFTLPVDWSLNPVYVECNMNVYWAEPPITSQGSMTVYGSSVGRPGENPTNVVASAPTPKQKTIKELGNLKDQFLTKNRDICIEYSNIKGEIESTKYFDLINQAPKRLEEFIHRLNSGSNFIIVKFGDGEMRNMISTNEEEHNCDLCHYFHDLGLDLINSYIYFLQNENAYINKWHSHEYNIQDNIETSLKDSFNDSRKFLYYDLLTHKLPFKEEQIRFFRGIKASKRPKIYVSNEYMIKALAPILNIDFGFVISPVDNYLHRETFYDNMTKLMHELETKHNITGVILLFSAGMFAKVMISVISHLFPNHTYIDIGSTFDALIRLSRDHHFEPGFRDSLISTYSA